MLEDKRWLALYLLCLGELMIVLEFSRHPGSDAMAQRVQEYATALDTLVES